MVRHSVTVNVTAPAEWAGFAFSRTGTMEGSDFVIGAVVDSQTFAVTDRTAVSVRADPARTPPARSLLLGAEPP